MNRINDPTSTVDSAFVCVPTDHPGRPYGYVLTDAERAQVGLPVLWANPPFGGDNSPSAGDPLSAPAQKAYGGDVIQLHG